MRDFAHRVASLVPEFVAYDEMSEGWTVMDYDGCSMVFYDSTADALDAVRDAVFPYLEWLLESGAVVITFVDHGCPFPQRFQECLSSRWLLT